MEYLTSYDGHDAVLHGVQMTANLPQSQKPRKIIEKILDDQMVFTCHGGYQKFLLQWKNRPILGCCVMDPSKTLE